MKTEVITAPAGLTEKQIAAVREAFAYFDRLAFKEWTCHNHCGSIISIGMRMAQ